MSEPVSQIQQDTKDRISMARMLCVLGMVFVHVPDGLSGTPIYSFNTASLGFFLEGFLVEGPGRASAALLSIVSGYLMAMALVRRGASVKGLYKKRFVSIVTPMVFWGALTCVVYLGVSLIRPTFLANANSVLDVLNFVLFITEMPTGATMHLAFLRDLFVCILLSPVLLIAVQRMPWVLLPLLALFYLFSHDQNSIVILRPLILFAFTTGMLLAVRQVNLKALDQHCPVFIALAVVGTALIMMVNGGAAAGLVDIFNAQGMDFKEVVLYPVSRLFGSLAIWTLIPIVMGGRFQALILKFSPYLFAAFCSHYLTLTVLYFGLWQPVFGDRSSPVFIVWFLAAPVTAMAIAVCIVKIAAKVAPPLATMITGGRVRTPQVSSPIKDRQRQSWALGTWAATVRLFDSLTHAPGAAIREWWAASRRLLLGRR